MPMKLWNAIGLLSGVLGGIVCAEEPVPDLDELHNRAVTNWPAPLLWSPGAPPRSSALVADEKSVASIPTMPLTFIGVSPCRLADTRDATKPPGYGPPALAAGIPRNFTVTGQCGIASEAAAVSLNITVVDPLGLGYILTFPQGGPFAPVSTLNFGAGQTVANAAIVPVGASGGITLDAGVSGTDLIIDVNGYYANDLSSEHGFFTFTSEVDGSSTLNVANTSNAPFATAGSFTTNSCQENSQALFGEAISGSGSTCGSIFGVHGFADGQSAGSAGVRGDVSGGDTNSIFGVLGTTSSHASSAAGVKGVGAFGDAPICGTCPTAGVLGTNSGGGTGVQGITVITPGPNGAASGYIIDSAGNIVVGGFLGWGSSAGGYGVFSQGNIGATGSKFFIEPHPTDASKVIRYVALEGPEAGTYFRGTAETRGGMAVIEVPETFRLVTERDGLTVQLTPIGELASLAVISEDLDRIVIRSSSDVRFHYQVNGVRHGFADFEPISTSRIFAPRRPDERIPGYLSEAEKRSLIANGTYNVDGTVNLETAKAQEWDRVWSVQPR